jgi:outer membrane biosynthesis protein TonB
MPELVKPQQKPAEMAREQPPQPAGGTPSGAAGSGVKGENVEVTTPQQNFKDAWYLLLVRDKIGQNWRPPPDAKDAKVRVIFTINRSGWTSPSDVNIDEKNSTGTYGFKLAAVRAILSSKPFPQLPDDFPKQTLELSVDLMAE